MQTSVAPRKAGAAEQAALAKRPGVVADYIAYLDGDTTVLQGDTTYLISDPVYCSSTLTINGGAVIKSTTPTDYCGPGTFAIYATGPVVCNGSEYRPITFANMEDDSVGECLAGYPGYGSHYQANPVIYSDNYSSGSLSLNHVRFSSAVVAVQVRGYPNQAYTFSHSQFVNCAAGIQIVGCGAGCGTSLALNNCLMANVGYPLGVEYGGNGYSHVECRNCTFDGVSTLFPLPTFPAITLATIQSWPISGAWG